ncbi:50S ribosomal protein L35 [Kyrpidia spormannii]|uniref:Large ribosomal subunit protein bL35 n=3 Tax=Kyrpidia TaxID=1129704 RepID=A0A2K8N837_9BACL|nr:MULTISPECIES: 50S ribosomal protein L35 [Kyrpidia]HHY68071.1 50S ribosomal protein L35 [Alicyclobacillus sp.]ADG06976.1 ribosomal protein L35 [Kyrpidia tusciae DSM 2912]ATY85501.1 50S ribosomal protein L35 [Kyrpidia spormannii]MBE3552476.1 50S ribosomal protein L35 [Kyrpidia tusciae]MCL6574930.1 50S ribosomal protein L35 [Kyrpidia sp.]
MPKMKTQRAAAKRFRKTGSGKLKRFHAYHSHLFTGKTPKRKRKLRKAALVSKGDFKRVRQLVTYLK